MEKINYQKLDELLFTETLQDLLNRAETGDVTAARDALHSIGHYLSSRNVDQVTGESLPVQPFLRDYLSKAFYDMGNGVDPQKALHLKKPGRKNRRQSEKRLAAYLVYQGVYEGGLQVLEAAMAAAEQINEKSRKDELRGQWRGFKGETVEFETLQDWYYQYKDKLMHFYEISTIKQDL